VPYYDTTTLSPDEKIAFRISDKVQNMYNNEAVKYDAKVNEPFVFQKKYTTNAYTHQGHTEEIVKHNADIANTIYFKPGSPSKTDPEPYHDPTKSSV